MIDLLFAQEAEKAASQGGGIVQVLLPLLIIFLIFYLLLIRPEQKRMKEHQKMISQLKKGDKIVTTGGLCATIVGFREGFLEVKLNEEVKVRITREAVARKIESSGEGENA